MILSIYIYIILVYCILEDVDIPSIYNIYMTLNYIYYIVIYIIIANISKTK